MTRRRFRSKDERNRKGSDPSAFSASLLRRARHGIEIAVSTAALVGCGSLSAKTPSLAAGVASGEHITAAPQMLDIDVVVRPRLGNDPHFELEVSTRSDDLPRRFVVQKSWAGEESVLMRIEDLRATCDDKPSELAREDLDTHVGWTTPQRCRRTTLTYRVGGSPEGLDWGNEYEAIVTPTFASAIAETALILPDVPDDTRARVEVFFDLGEMPGSEGVYSLGKGLHDTTTRALRHAYFAAGKFITITHQVGQLKLEARFAGNVQFQVDAAMRDLDALLVQESQMFSQDAGDTLRLLVVGMPPAHGSSHGTSLTESASIWIDGTVPWSDEDARLAAHEMFHLYNGQVVRRNGPDEKTYWLSEGFTEHYTDELMLRAGAFNAFDWYEAIRYRIRAYESHKDAETPNDRAELGWGGSAAQLPYLRGSLIAAFVDYTIRKESKGTRTLDDFMRRLVVRARSGKPPLDQTEILHLLGEEIGEPALEVVKSVAIDGKRITLPRDTFGSCVEVVGSGADTDLRIRAGVDLVRCVASGR